MIKMLMVYIIKAIILIIVGIVCYYNTLRGTFVFDDLEAVVNNVDLNPETPLTNLFYNDFWGNNISSSKSHKSYRPITILVYRALTEISGRKDPVWFHTLNIVLYVLVCIALYAYLVVLLNDKIAFPTSLLFTTHPIHTEVVASIVGCADLLCSLLFFLSLIQFHSSMKSSSTHNYIFSLLLTAIATFCKEIGITALGVFFLFDLLYNAEKRKRFPQKQFIYRSCGTFITGLFLLYIRGKIMNFTQPTFQPVDNPTSFADNLLTRFFTYSYIYILNLIILIWPQWLCFDWSMGCIPLVQVGFNFKTLAVIFFWILGTYFIYTAIIKQDKITCIALVMLIIPFLPASNALFRVGFVIAERVLFLPSVGVCLLVIQGWHKICCSLFKYKKKCMFAYYVLFIIFSLRTQERAKQWINEYDLFSSALEVCPLNAKVHYNIAKVAADLKKYDYAESEYRYALNLYPSYDQAMNNLANLLRDRGEVQQARELLTNAVSLRPDFAAAWMNLGIVLATLGEDEQAEASYKTALKYRRKYCDCYYNLGNLYLKQSQQKKALQMWLAATEINSSHSAAWSNILVLLDTMGEYEKVLEYAKIALKSCPDSAAIHFTYANTLGKLQWWEDSEIYFKRAIELSPENALYYSNFGVLYHRWGKLDDAKHMYETALLLNPQMDKTADNLKRITKSKSV